MSKNYISRTVNLLVPKRIVKMGELIKILNYVVLSLSFVVKEKKMDDDMLMALYELAVITGDHNSLFKLFLLIEKIFFKNQIFDKYFGADVMKNWILNL